MSSCLCSPVAMPADSCCNASHVLNTGVRNPNSGACTADVLLTKPSLSSKPSPLFSLLSQSRGSSFSQIFTLLVTWLLHTFELHISAERPLLPAAESQLPLHCIVPASYAHLEMAHEKRFRKQSVSSSSLDLVTKGIWGGEESRVPCHICVPLPKLLVCSSVRPDLPLLCLW